MPGGRRARKPASRANALSSSSARIRSRPFLARLELGIAIGLAIRFASEHDEAEIETKPLSKVDLSFLTLPFLWPFFRTVKDRYEDTADVVKDRVNEGVDRLRKVDVDDYVKPLKKKVRSWTR